MTDQQKRNESNADRNGLALIAVALVFGGLAVVADLLWMAPHASSMPVVAREQVAKEQPATQAQSPSATVYFPSQFTLHAKDKDEPESPTF